ncbi:hypothetical protein AORI_7335 [Amycolatopsis keratiniphila]|uniref:Uncharacterized protein n=1 Tax=Amycolatopsis keratiniphila TaxID=129921 RepID=R4TGU7_9PSEU|nr:hypothetical protein AORI_7335 [Amycolatopsis keratiniphila]
MVLRYWAPPHAYYSAAAGLFLGQARCPRRTTHPIKGAASPSRPSGGRSVTVTPGTRRRRVPMSCLALSRGECKNRRSARWRG